MRNCRLCLALAALVAALGLLASVPLPVSFFKQGGSSIPLNLYTGLVHAYMFNENTGTNVLDKAGSNDLTFRGGPSWETKDGTVSVVLNGTSQWLDTTAFTLGANNVSMVGWFYFTNAVIASQMMLIEKETVNAQWELFFNLGYQIRGNGTVPTGGGTSPSTGAWHQLAGTITGTNCFVYVDGVDVTTAFGVVAFTDTSSALQIGRFNSGFFFKGWVGPVYIYNRVLSASEMLQLYTVKYLY